jgi:hypothetical protein
MAQVCPRLSGQHNSSGLHNPGGLCDLTDKTQRQNSSAILSTPKRPCTEKQHPSSRTARSGYLAKASTNLDASEHFTVYHYRHIYDKMLGEEQGSTSRQTLRKRKPGMNPSTPDSSKSSLCFRKRRVRWKLAAKDKCSCWWIRLL